jgi:O-methyltransferase
MLRKALTLLIAMLAVAGFLSVIVSAVVIVNLRTTDVKGISGAPPKPMLPLPIAEERYLDLMKRVLTRYGFEAYERRGGQRGAFASWVYSVLDHALAARGEAIVKYDPAVWTNREEGRGWPSSAETMIGLKRMDNIQFCVTDVIRQKVPGDLIECGAWRGGACIFMRAILAAYEVKDRLVWVSDSFEGLPNPKEDQYPEAHIWQGGEMAVSLEEVRGNFRKYGLLDDQVKFLKGFFIDTLPKAPIERLAVLRVDGDLYESVTQTLNYMYPKLSPGGYVILDDYGDHLPPAKKAVDDYRSTHGITAPLKRIDYSGAFWQKPK